ncbi:MAG: O-antigen ligase family protein, partial [Candidatus Eiseniibacteriota bacterium]
MGCWLLVATSVLSVTISVHRGKSLEDMLNLLAITGLFLTAAIALRSGTWLRRVAVLEVIAAIPVAALGIFQHFRPDLMPAANSYPGRALGPFGQPNRLGGYLVALIPVAIALSFAIQDRWIRLALLASAFVLTLCLVATLSRGAWVGGAFGLLVLALLLLRWPELAPRPLVAAMALAALLLPALLLWPSVLSRITSKASPETAWNLPIDPEREGSGSLRRAIWGGALAAFAARPVLGWGIGAFREAYDRSKSDALKRLEAEGGRTADQAHSYFLVTLAERGVLGLAAFLLFASLCVGAGLAGMGSGPVEGRLLVAGLLASVAALVAHAALFEDNLSFAPHGTLFFANLGLLAAAAPRTPASGGRWARGAGVAGLLLAVLGVGLAGASAVASTEAHKGNLALITGATNTASACYATATTAAPWSDELWAGRAQAALARGRDPFALREAETSYRKAIAVNGSDPVLRHQLARLYLSNQQEFGAAGATAAVRELHAALSQNPYYAEIRNDYGVALLATGDRAGAMSQFRAASDSRRDFVDPLLNMATLELQDGNTAEASRLIADALNRDPGSARAAAMRAGLPG